MEDKKNYEIQTTLSIVKDSSAKLDPSDIDFVSEYYYLDNFTRKLVKLDQHGNYELDLASQIQYYDNKKTWRVSLNEAYFSNGEKITSSDVKATFLRLIKFGSSHSNLKEYIKGNNYEDANKLGLKIIDQSTIELHFKKNINEFLYYLTLADYGILSREQYNKDKLTFNDWRSAVSGPYSFDGDKNETKIIFNKYFPHKKNAPKTILSKSQVNIESVLKENDIDYGPIPFSYFLNQKENILSNGYEILSSPNQSIICLGLNPNGNMSKENVKRWIYKKITMQFEIPQKLEDSVKKAYQFFIPAAKGFLEEKELISLVDTWDIDTTKVPEEIKDGLKIRTFVRSGEYIIPNLDTLLTKALGVNVEIKYDIEPSQFNKTLETRDYDILLIPIFMDYKVVGEALNFSFSGKDPIFSDKSTNIRKLLKKYLESEVEDQKKQFISSIVKQIVNDAEVIPLFYGFSPVLKAKRINIKNLNKKEIYQLWNLNVLEE